MGHGVDHQRLALQRLHPAGEEDVVAVGARVARKEVLAHGRRVIQRLRRDPERGPEPFLDVVRVGEHPLRLAQRDPVGLPHHVPNGAAVVLALEVGVVGVIPQLVGGAVLMDQPHDLALVLGQVGRELQPDHGVDLQAVGLADVEAAPDRHLMGEHAWRIPVARDLHQIGLMPGDAERLHQRLGMRLGTPTHERGLRMQDRDPHGASLSGGSGAAASSSVPSSDLSRSTSASRIITFSDKIVVSSA